MAAVSPFRGIRYREDIPLDDVVAPPYDVLSTAQAAELRARSPYNAVLVDRPSRRGRRPARDLCAGGRAVSSLARRGPWCATRRRAWALSIRLTSAPTGVRARAAASSARLRLEDLEEGVVLPHERTHAGPKVDRLRLIRAAAR